MCKSVRYNTERVKRAFLYILGNDGIDWRCTAQQVSERAEYRVVKED